jgi:hypothetical protein
MAPKVIAEPRFPLAGNKSKKNLFFLQLAIDDTEI